MGRIRVVISDIGFLRIVAVAIVHWANHRFDAWIELAIQEGRSDMQGTAARRFNGRCGAGARLWRGSIDRACNRQESDFWGR